MNAELEIAKRPDGSDWMIGSGAFGQVYKAFRNKVQPVAVKVMKVTPVCRMRETCL
jgi:hypothetical protein